MKKIFVLFAFMSLVSFAVNAQTCPHAKKSSSSASVEATSDYAKTVAAAAAMDESIEQKVCAKSGNVSYEKKNVCEVSGKVSYTAVEYDAATAKFVNVSPSDAAASGKKACCTGGSKKACCAGGSAKSCTKKSSSSASSSATESGAKVKMVKSEQ
jgi:hypothetical protein